jgi:hypothetical protein
MSGSGVITNLIGFTSQKLGKDTDAIYEDMFGGFSMPRDKLTKGIVGAELKNGGLVRGYGAAIKGKKRIRVL